MTDRLAPGWYILLYHGVSWDDPAHVRHVSLTCPPDVFRDHVETCERLGRLVGVPEAVERLQQGKPDEPLISFWFDDGLAGVREHAAPILAARGCTGAISICSRFVERTEMFWRFKLSYLHAIGEDDLLRRSLADLGCGPAESLRSFTIDRFSDELLAALDDLYLSRTPRHVREAAFNLFDTAEGLRALRRQGWVVSNHSAAHYPVGESHVLDQMLPQFDECEAFIRDLVGGPSGYWVFPFDRKLDAAAVPMLRAQRPEQTVVLVGNQVNDAQGLATGAIRRLSAPPTGRSRLRDDLLKASAAFRAAPSAPAAELQPSFARSPMALVQSDLT